MAQPTREEIIAYITQEAKRRGLGVEEALAIAMGESGLDPAAKGDYRGGQPQSGGLFQMFNKGGMGNDFTAATGLSSMDPESWKEQVNFALDQAATGGQGWGPWYARLRPDVNVGQWQGIPGQTPASPGRRGRAGEVAQGAPMFPTIGGQQQAQKEPGLLELLRGIKPERQQTLAGLATDALGWTDKDDPNRPSTLLGLGLQKAGLTGPEKKKAKVEESLAEVNAFAPKNEVEQLTAELKKKKPVTLANLFMGAEAPATPTTVGGRLFKSLGFG